MTTILDGDRNLEFEGELLGHATSRRGSDRNIHRWTEVSIWLTAGGRYIVQKAGKSRVYHEEHSPRASGKNHSVAQLHELPVDVLVDLVGDTVHPPRKMEDVLVSQRGVVLETERSTCHISTTAAGVIESLHNEDKLGVTYITKIAKAALMQACDKDPDLADAWKTERVH